MEAAASATSPSITSKPRAEEGDVGRIKKGETDGGERPEQQKIKGNAT